MTKLIEDFDDIVSRVWGYLPTETVTYFVSLGQIQTTNDLTPKANFAEGIPLEVSIRNMRVNFLIINGLSYTLNDKILILRNENAELTRGKPGDELYARGYRWRIRDQIKEGEFMNCAAYVIVRQNLESIKNVR